MAVNIDNLIITTPVAKSATDPTALEVTGAVALATLPDYVARLPDGSVRMSAQPGGLQRHHLARGWLGLRDQPVGPDPPIAPQQVVNMLFTFF